MALVEGYSEHVMDSVGARVLPADDGLCEAMDASPSAVRRLSVCSSGCSASTSSCASTSSASGSATPWLSAMGSSG